MNEIKLRWLFMGSLINNIAVSTVWPLTTVYMHDALGKSLTEVGIILFLYSASNVLGNYIGGKLFDHHNRYILTILGIIFSILVSAGLIFFNGWPAYPIGLVLFGFSTGWNLTMINSLGTTVKMKSGRFIFNMLYLAQNVGVVFGTMAVGILYPIGISSVFLLSTIILIIYGINAILTYNKSASIHPSIKKVNKKRVKLPKPNLIIIMTFFVSLALIWIVYEQWVSNMSVYITGMGIPMSMYSLLWTLNAFLLVVFQLIINWLAKYYDNLYFQIYFGIIFIGLSFFTLIFMHSYLGFVISMIILTLGETSVIPAIPALVNELTPITVKGKYQGLTNAWASIGKAIGPLVGGIVIDISSYQLLFISSFAVCLITVVISFSIIKILRE
ncbi:MFS transporter [Apilactobacillus micheneri]|uniref:MDR family MFS transporter n=1 Tax=Apilactobacillus micheneri TaxID=1899430 RepID=UPI001129E0B9|nr:MFS transporter [Apilactobacillus micheneri]TPR39090.1 MFS transporter [Apilactobacillus micheneri]TPR50621.1 MFS transporter [Apilactobacillus micheneri]